MTELPTGAGYHWNEQLVHANYDKTLDTVLAAKETELDAQFERPVPDVTGIPPNSEARPHRLISDAERELADTARWLDALIATLPDEDD